MYIAVVLFKKTPTPSPPKPSQPWLELLKMLTELFQLSTNTSHLQNLATSTWYEHSTILVYLDMIWFPEHPLLPKCYGIRNAAAGEGWSYWWAQRSTTAIPHLWQCPVAGAEGKRVESKGKVNAWSFNISSKFFLKKSIIYVLLYYFLPHHID